MNRGVKFLIGASSFDRESGKIECSYDLDGQKFTETYHLPDVCTGGDPEVVDRLLKTHSVFAGVSYYKTSLPQTIEIAHPISAEDKKFFTTVYEKGLGELFFKNKIDPKGIINFVCHGEPDESMTRVTLRRAQGDTSLKRTLRALVPFGGGKDSVVTAMLLRDAGYQVTLLRVGAHGVIDRLANALGLPLLIVDRRLDPLLFELNTKGAFNGHVPITAILSALSMVVAETCGFDLVAFSNERSASDANTVWNDLEINHQWSKSLEFEEAFRKHLREAVGTSLEYVSLLRPWSELQIVQKFVEFDTALPLFTSCNKNWKIDKDSRLETRGSKLSLWCKECPKCAFVSLLLAAFLPRDRVLEIQGGDTLADAKLLPLYEELLGLERHKPFECVGTPEETAAAFHLAHERNGYDDSLAMKRYLESPLAKRGKDLAKEALTPSDAHCLSVDLLNVLS